MKQTIQGDSVALPTYSIEWGRAPTVEGTDWLGEGDFCSCYFVNTSYVFRFAKHAEASAAMRVERCLLPFLGQHLAVAVPQVEFAGRRDDTGQAMIGYTIIPGKPLDQEVLERLPATSQAVLIGQLADVMRQLHALRPQLLSQCSLPTRDPLMYLTSIIQQARAALWPQLSGTVAQYYEQLLDQYANEPLLHSYQPALLHGDLSPDHILADTEQIKLTGIIDFGDACIGDPAWDMIYIYEDYGPATLQTFLERYDPHNRQLIARKVRIYQQLNNVAYCLSLQSDQDDEELDSALATLEEQAMAGDA